MKEYFFRSRSNPKAPRYVTTVHDDGTISCTCPARNGCWHVTLVKMGGLVGYCEETPIGWPEKEKIFKLMDGPEEDLHDFVQSLFPSMTRKELKLLMREVYELNAVPE